MSRDNLLRTRQGPNGKGERRLAKDRVMKFLALPHQAIQLEESDWEVLNSQATIPVLSLEFEYFGEPNNPDNPLRQLDVHALAK